MSPSDFARTATRFAHRLNRMRKFTFSARRSIPETWAVSKSDLFMKDPTGRDADNIAFGSTLSNDRHAQRRFDYLIANPPYGKDWKRDEDAVRAEHERGAGGRFAPGLPRISDGQLLFLMHMLAHAKAPNEGGSRIAIIMNGSPLFTGDAGSGESEIRRFILENDLLEALIALPEQLFYNTGIATYVWVVTNRKAAPRKGLVQLIDASSPAFWAQMRKSLGDKRREIPVDRAQDILKILTEFKDGDKRIASKDGVQVETIVSKVFPTTHFGYRKITTERPLRLNFHASPERIARLEGERGFQSARRSPRRRAAQERKRELRARRNRRGSAKSLGRYRIPFLRTAPSLKKPWKQPLRRPGLDWRCRSRKQCFPRCQNAMKQPSSAAIRRATPSLIPSCATARTCRSRKMWMSSSRAK